jgi:predicted porin
MNKKLMALAIAGAFAPAIASAAPQFYGRAVVGIDTYEATGATAGSTGDFKSRQRVWDSGSRFGVHGSEDLGGGLKAVYQIESGVNIDTGDSGGQAGAGANGSTGFLASRDSYGGLQGPWGQVTWGRQSIYWVSGRLAQSGANYIETDVASTGTLGRVAPGVARVSNTMAYNSPNLGGANFTVSYSPQSEATGAGVDKTDATITGLTARYSGPVYAQVDWTQNKSQSPATGPQRKRTGLKGGVGYPYMPGAMISVMYISAEDENTGAVAGFSTAGDTVKQHGVLVNWEHEIGQNQLLAEFMKGSDATGCSPVGGCDKTGFTSYMVAWRYLFSKTTSFFVNYIKVKNDDNATFDISGGGISSASASGGSLPNGSAGADPQIIGAGVRIHF